MPLWTDPDLWVPQDAGGVAQARSSPLPPNVVRPGVHGASGNGAPTVPDPGPYDPDSAEAS